MQLARIIGDIVATHKDPTFEGLKLLLLQPLAADGTDAGRALVAVDAVGAGVGERVFFVRGKEASFPFHPVEVAADACIVGIVDHWSVRDDSAVEPAAAAEPHSPAAQRARDASGTRRKGGHR